MMYWFAIVIFLVAAIWQLADVVDSGQAGGTPDLKIIIAGTLLAVLVACL